MRKVGVFALQPGLILGEAVYSNSGSMLLPAGAELTHKNITKLKDFEVPYVHVRDDFLTGINMVPLIDQKVRHVAEQQVAKILLSVRETKQLAISSLTLDRVANQLLNQLLDKRDLMLNLMDLHTRDNYTFIHSVNVCVLALMTGLTLNYSAEDMLILGAGALLHDVGKEMIPDEVLNKPGKLNSKEYTQIKNHTVYGYDLISSTKELGETAAKIALQHHEHYDGSGYPQGLKGKDFHEFAQIVAIADKFDALTSDRVYRNAYKAHEAYELCAASGNYLVKEEIMQAFLHNIAAYAPGTLVQLNNGQVGVVIDTPKGYSVFPRVKLLFDQFAQPISPYEVNLVRTPGLAVIKVLNDHQAVPLILKYHNGE